MMEAKKDRLATRSALIANLDELKNNQPLGGYAFGKEVVVVPTHEGPRAYEGRCPHQGTLLSEGHLKDGELVCRAHGYRFSCATGERLGASGASLLGIPCRTEAGKLWVDRSSRLNEETSPPSRSSRTLVDLPGPHPFPLVGNILQVDLKRVHLQLEAWAKQYGTLYRIRLGAKNIVVVSDPRQADSILRARPGLYRRDSNIESIMEELGAAGVFSVEGLAWRRQRKLAMDALSSRHLRAFYAVLLRVGERLLNRLQRKAQQRKPFAIQDDLMRFTVDVTTSLAFGTDMNTLERESDPIQKHLSHLPEALARRIFSPFPYWRYVTLARDRQLNHALGKIQETLKDLVQDARTKVGSRSSLEPRAENFLQAMLLSRNEDGSPFSDEVIFGNTLTMLLAGEDTTAHTIAWIVHEICDRPAVLSALHEDVDRCLGGNMLPDTPEKAQQMPYLDAVIHETMRLRSVAPFLALQANENAQVADIALPKGTGVYVLLRAPSLNSSHFAEPLEFRPERWLEGSGVSPHTPDSHIPFGSGPRICPGRSLALIEMRLVVSMLLKSFRIARHGTREAVKERFAFTVHPENLRVRLEYRA